MHFLYLPEVFGEREVRAFDSMILKSECLKYFLCYRNIFLFKRLRYRIHIINKDFSPAQVFELVWRNAETIDLKFRHAWNVFVFRRKTCNSSPRLHRNRDPNWVTQRTFWKPSLILTDSIWHLKFKGYVGCVTVCLRWRNSV